MQKINLYLAVLFCLQQGIAQKSVYYPEYNNGKLQEGSYELKSTSKKYQEKKLPIINSKLDTIKPIAFPKFIYPNNKEIVLFEGHNMNDLKPVGKLITLTQVILDSIIHKYKYTDFTNCVWNRIIINNKAYYTDIDIHDFSFSEELKELNQNMIVVGQFDGYDGAYHLGYPEKFFLLFTNNKNVVISTTEILDFYLNDEFAMEDDILNMQWDKNKSTYQITLIGHDEKIRINWNGTFYLIKKLN